MKFTERDGLNLFGVNEEVLKNGTRMICSIVALMNGRDAPLLCF